MIIRRLQSVSSRPKQYQANGLASPGRLKITQRSSDACLWFGHTAVSAADMPLASHARQRNKAQVSPRYASCARCPRLTPCSLPGRTRARQ